MARNAIFREKGVSAYNRSSLAHELGRFELNKEFVAHRFRMSLDSEVSTDEGGMIRIMYQICLVQILARVSAACC